MSTLAERLKKSRKDKNLTQKELGDMIGLSQNSIQKIENGSTQEPKKIVQIAEVLGVNVGWLQTGKDSNDGINVTNSKFSNSPISNSVTKTLNYARQTTDENALAQSEPDDKHYHRIDYLDVRMAAGKTEYANTDYPEIIKSIWLSDDGMVELVGRRTTNGLYITNTPTDSMEPTIPKNSPTLIDTNVKSYIGDGIYAFVIDGNLFIKRLQKLVKGGYLVISDNKPKYQDEEMSSEYIDNAYFVGKYVTVWKIDTVEL